MKLVSEFRTYTQGFMLGPVIDMDLRKPYEYAVITFHLGWWEFTVGIEGEYHV